MINYGTGVFMLLMYCKDHRFYRVQAKEKRNNVVKNSVGNIVLLSNCYLYFQKKNRILINEFNSVFIETYINKHFFYPYNETNPKEKQNIMLNHFIIGSEIM